MEVAIPQLLHKGDRWEPVVWQPNDTKESIRVHFGRTRYKVRTAMGLLLSFKLQLDSEITRNKSNAAVISSLLASACVGKKHEEGSAPCCLIGEGFENKLSCTYHLKTTKAQRMIVKL